MAGTRNEALQKHVESTGDLAKKMGELRASLQKSLREGYELSMGEKMPTGHQCKVFKVDTVMEYGSAVKFDSLMSAAKTLLKAGFAGDDEASLVLKAMDVVDVALRSIFGELGISLEIKGDSAFVKHDGEEYFTAMYAVTQVCSSKEWFVETDFVLSEYAFFVERPNVNSVTPQPLVAVPAGMSAAPHHPGAVPHVRLPQVRRI